MHARWLVVLLVNLVPVAAMAARTYKPSFHGQDRRFRRFSAADLLRTSSISEADAERKVAAYGARAPRGAKPTDLPAEAVSKFELLINPNTAKALRLTMQRSLLARDVEVIE